MRINLIGTDLDSTTYADANASILDWAFNHESRYVCVANVHMVMEGYDHPEFRSMVNQADLVTPDGVPLVWSLRRMGMRDQKRVYGPELTLRLLATAEENEIPVGFFGGEPETLDLLVKNVHQQFPGVQIAYTFSPPFRPISLEEDELIVKGINDSGARILFVGLGCPKQEKWMAAHVGQVQTVMVGVGAAFDFIAGTKQKAPGWMQSIGMEWLFRLGQEPGRLWRRYFYHNPRFIILVMLPLLFRCSPQSPSL